MGTEQPTAHEASLFMGTTLTVSMIGIFTGIFFLFINIDFTIRTTTAILVGVVGIISFVRHSVCHRSPQVRMGWRQVPGRVCCRSFIFDGTSFPVSGFLCPDRLTACPEQNP